MELKVGTVLEGKVKTITKFGAFVTLPENQTGMVHISEVANCYVSDIAQHLTVGQSVKVKVMSVDETGKISLSIKRAEERPQTREATPRESNKNRDSNPCRTESSKPTTEAQSFEGMLKQFMTDSDSKISGCAFYDHPRKTRRR